MTTGIQGRKSSLFLPDSSGSTSDYLSLANQGAGIANLSPNSDEPFSISGWFFTEETGTQTIMSNVVNSANDGYWFGLNGGKASFKWSNTSGNPQLTSTGNETTYYGGPWVHMVITYNGGGNATGLTLYTNNAFAVAGSSSGIGTTTNASDEIRIGQGSLGGFKGCVSNVSFWDKELTPAEIDYIYHGNDGGRGPGDLNYHPSFSNCIGWWLADHPDDDSTKIYDATSNGRNFTVNGSSSVLRKMSP
jgi:hypothetical protein